MKAFALVLLVLPGLSTFAGAAEKPALVEKHDIVELKRAVDPALRGFRNFIYETYEADSDHETFIISSSFKVRKDQRGFYLPEVTHLLSGRINHDFKLDLSISDREASVNAFAITEAKILGNYRPKYDAFVKFFLPFSVEDLQERELSWTTKDLENTERELRALMTDKRINTYLLKFETGNDPDASLMGFYIPETGEFLLIGFGNNP